MIIFKKFQQKIFFICMIHLYPVYRKGKLNWPSLPRSRIYIIVLLYKSLPRLSQFLFLKHIFLLSHTKKNLFRFSSPPFQLFTIKFTIFYFKINSFSKFNKFFIRVSVYQIKYIFYYYVMFYHDSYHMYLVLQYLTQLSVRGLCGRDRLVAGSTTTYAISIYHH